MKDDDVVIGGGAVISMTAAQLADMKKAERALLRLNPKELTFGAYFQVRYGKGSFCVVGAIRAANSLGKGAGVSAKDTKVMARLAYGEKGAYFLHHSSINRLIDVNDGFRGTMKDRYKHVLAFVQNEIARLEKATAA